MIRPLVHIIFISILFTSCKNKVPDIISYKLERKDFLEFISARGTLQTINSTTINSPRVSAQDMTVVYLKDEGSYVKKGDTICILDAVDLYGYIESLQISLENDIAEMKKLEADNTLEMSLLRAKIETNYTKVALNSLDSIQQKFAPPIKQKLFALELEKANVEKEKLQKKYTAQQRINDAEIRAMKSRIARSENQLKVYVDQQNSLILTAPFDGIVIHVENPIRRGMAMSGIISIGGKIEINSLVWSNNPLLQMPDLSQFQLSVQVPEVDYKRIETGQKVLITVEALKNLNTTGLVKKKSLAGNNSDPEVKIKSFEIIVSIDSCHSQLKPELSAECKIIINEAKDTVVVPTLAIFIRDSSKIIYVSKAEKFAEVMVETGISNSSESIIIKGLEGNETIALMEPPYKLIMKKVNKHKDSTAHVDSIKIDSVKKKPIVTKIL